MARLGSRRGLGWKALLAVLAVLLQAPLTAAAVQHGHAQAHQGHAHAAMAHAHGGGGKPGKRSGGFGGLACEQCLWATFAAAAAPAPPELSPPAQSYAELTPAAAAPYVGASAPPRPRSRAPPPTA